MINTRIFSVHIFLLLMSTALLFSENPGGNPKPSVAVQPLGYPDEPVYEGLADTVEETLSLTLRLLGSYAVISLEQEEWRAELPLESVAEKHALDNIITGSIREVDTGIRLTLKVFNRKEGSTVLTRAGTAESLLDIFEVTDRITLELLEGFTNTHIAFGSLFFRNTGEDRDYVIYIDGQIVGRNVQNIPKITYGRKMVRIADVAAGRNAVESAVEVPENDSAVLEFALPYLYSDERRHIDELDSYLVSTWHGHRGRPETPLKEIDSFIDPFQGRELSELREKYARLRERLRAFRGDFDYLPIADIVPDGLSEDWEEVPSFLNDTQNEPMERPALPVESMPGSDLGMIKVARSEDQARLSFLIELGNGQVSSGVVYQIGLFRPNYPELRISFRKAGFTWSSEARFLREFENDLPVNIDISIADEGSFIEGNLRVRDLPIFDDIRSGRYALRFYTARSNPRGVYDDTFLKRIAFFAEPELPAHAGPDDRLEEVYFPAIRRITLDAKSSDWNGVHPCVDLDNWEDGAPHIDINVDYCSLARDGDNLYMLVRLEGSEELVLENDRLLELVIWGDELEEGWQAFFQLRIQNSRPRIDLHKVRGVSNEGIKSIEAGRYVYNPEAGTIEIRFPLDQVRGHLSSKPAYRAELRISDYSEEWHKKSRPFVLGLY